MYHTFEKVANKLTRPRELARFLSSPLFFERSNSHKLLVVGSGRSGTTWLSELINYDLKLRFVFEPLEGGWGINYKALKPWLCCDVEEICKPLENDMRHLFYGFYRGHGMDTWNAKRLTIYNGRLVKTIRMQGLLSVVNRLFPEIKIVYIMRHPCSVLKSYYQHEWSLEVSRLSSSISIDHPLVGEYMAKLLASTSTVDQYVYFWAIENRIALNQLEKIPHHLCFYEDLVGSSAQSMESLFGFLGKGTASLALENISTPSSHCRYLADFSDSARKAYALENWKTTLPVEYVDRCLEIVYECSLSHIYTDELLPLASLLR